MRLVSAVLVGMLASIAGGTCAQPSQQRDTPWDELTRKGVLRAHIWTVSPLPLPNGQTTCEASSFGNNSDGNYAIRLRAALPNPLLVVSLTGQPFYNVHEIKLTLDDTDLATLPIIAHQSNGPHQGVVGELKEPEFDQMVARMNAGRVLTARVGEQDFSVPVTGFNDVIVAIGQCNKQHEAQARKPKS
jgi:hypothetical protein